MKLLSVFFACLLAVSAFCIAQDGVKGHSMTWTKVESKGNEMSNSQMPHLRQKRWYGGFGGPFGWGWRRPFWGWRRPFYGGWGMPFGGYGYPFWGR
ncbi:hypothetical protein GCK72_011931 [Caenorhabditis remanei]|uniref:Uncharacterized protein n=1 Tax=Caenorhabditis remanei TaxID=31234 RepID=A0A6A5HA05_CAERE|nr:hypothetical protein GCK72_011931 [Caenorhabditis remanei]KAF1763664.1 hypothetical protein GCK72_011931 [Caenorhabditis remanei]